MIGTKGRFPLVNVNKNRKPITTTIGFEIFSHVALGTGLLLFLCILVPGVDPILQSAGGEAPFLSKLISEVSRDVRQNLISIVAYAVIGDAVMLVILGLVKAKWLRRIWSNTVTVVLAILLFGVMLGFIAPLIFAWMKGR